jgi:hypothetical protein
MPFFGSLLVAATVIALPASAQTVAAPSPPTITLSPNNCGTPDTPKPCHYAKKNAFIKGGAPNERDNSAEVNCAELM